MKDINNICFLVNGNQKIGLGHIYRCITIAIESNKRGIYSSFIIQKNIVIEGLLTINKLDFQVVTKNVWNSPKEYKQHISKYLLNTDVILLDLLEEEFIKFNFLPELNKKIVSITSFYYSEENRYEDISFFPGIEEKNHKVIQQKGKEIKLYSGPKYLTFRKEFQEISNKKFKRNVPEVLVTMGGSDAFGFTSIVVKALLDLDIKYKAIVIMGKAASNFEEVKKLAARNSNIKIKKRVNNIAEIMQRSTIAIINGGLTRYELAITGTPFIALSIHQIQYNITERVTELVGGVNLGIVSQLTQKDITNSIKELLLNTEKRQAISNKLQKIIDSKGTSRILDCIEDI